MPNLTVIIPMYNLWELTKNCLKSLADFQESFAIEVILVNNGSLEVSKEDILSFGQSLWQDNFRLVQLQENMGFAKACNIGAKLAKSDLIFFLNNDTLAFQNYLGYIFEHFLGDEISTKKVLAPLLIYDEPERKSFSSGRVQHLGIAFNPDLSVEHLYNFFPYTHPLVQKTGRKLQALSAAALIIPKRFFLELGGFCEDYVNGFEDMDLCLTALKHGAELLVEPKAVLIHLESRTEGRKNKESANVRLLTKRWSKVICPDLHQLLQADGYELYLNPALELQVKVQSELEIAYLARYKQDLPALFNKILAEPLWQKAYTYFWDFYAKDCQPEACLSLALLESSFFNNLNVLQRLAYYMHELGEDNSQILAKIDNYQAKIQDKSALQAKKSLILQKAQDFNDQFLYNLYASNHY